MNDDNGIAQDYDDWLQHGAPFNSQFSGNVGEWLINQLGDHFGGYMNHPVMRVGDVAVEAATRVVKSDSVSDILRVLRTEISFLKSIRHSLYLYKIEYREPTFITTKRDQNSFEIVECEPEITPLILIMRYAMIPLSDK